MKSLFQFRVFVCVCVCVGGGGVPGCISNCGTVQLMHFIGDMMDGKETKLFWYCQKDNTTGISGGGKKQPKGCTQLFLSCALTTGHTPVWQTLGWWIKHPPNHFLLHLPLLQRLGQLPTCFFPIS